MTIAFLAIGAFFLVSEHRAHVVPWLPWLILLACPLLHFGHGGHGGMATPRTTSPTIDRIRRISTEATVRLENHHERHHSRLWTMVAGHHQLSDFHLLRL
ncbi:DUF2933 domain-containing protein (plasmid) [Mesorhizobium atlanticum]|uniref:DUF2933 domain-containing protein n=1 Tax=Mesorhizobium atlanticum TaxID=2233532 RepID=UPI003703FD83